MGMVMCEVVPWICISGSDLTYIYTDPLKQSLESMSGYSQMTQKAHMQ